MHAAVSGHSSLQGKRGVIKVEVFVQPVMEDCRMQDVGSQLVSELCVEGEVRVSF